MSDAVSGRKAHSLTWALRWRMATLKNGFQDAMAYRVEFFLQFLGHALVPAAVQWVIWYSYFKLGGQTELAGMTYPQLLSYTFTSMLFSQVRGGDHDFELAEMIRSGQLSNYLLRPVGVVGFVYIRGVSEKLFIAMICLVAGLVSCIFTGLAPIPLLVGMVMAILGNIIHYMIGASIASVSFAWEESYSLLMVKNLLVSVLSGELLPLTLFPSSWEWMWKYTPFYLYVFGPTQIALQKWSWNETLFHFGIAGFWLVFAWTLVRTTWGYGIKHYSSLGG